MWPTLAALATAGATSFAAWAVRGRSSQLCAPSVWRFPAGRRRIALTFDDGPSESTPALLALLARHQAKATFFVCGQNASRLPAIVEQIHAAGHEIGNHSYSHPRFDFSSPAAMADQIGRTQTVLEKLTGRTPTLFRVPYGVRWPGLGRIQRQFGLTGVMWTAIGRDWTLPAPSIVRRLTPQLRDGYILCLHDGRILRENPDITPTLDAMQTLLPLLDKTDLSSASVSEMLER